MTDIPTAPNATQPATIPPESVPPSKARPDAVVPHRVAPYPAAQRHNPGKALTMLGLAMLTLAVCYLWLEQQKLATTANQMATELGQLSARPAPDLGPLATRLAQLDRRLTALEQRPASRPAPLPAVTASVDLAPLEARLTALEQRPVSADVGQRLIALEQKQAIAVALAAGRKLGPVQGAPPALARFADTAPPTEAALRLEFRPLAARAAQASRPSTESQSLAEHIWVQIRAQVTVTDHDKVLIGAPATIILGDAAEKLDAGDLAGAVASLGTLDPGAAAIMADWKARAQALLDARAALATMEAPR